MTILDRDGVELAASLEAAKEGVRRALQIEADAAIEVLHKSNGAIIVDGEFSNVLEGPRAASGAEPESVPAPG